MGLTCCPRDACVAWALLAVLPPELLLHLDDVVLGELGLRGRNRCVAISRRTMLLVILGQWPSGSIDFLQIGHKELISVRNSSMHSGWNMCPQRISRITVTLLSNSSKQM